MNFRPQKSKAIPKRDLAPETLPTPELLDPSFAERQQVTFQDDAEDRFINRQLSRAKLLKNNPAAVVPTESDLEVMTKHFYRNLQALSNSDERVDQLEIKNLMHTFNTNSLFNLATSLAELALKEDQKKSLSQFWAIESSNPILGRLESDGSLKAGVAARVPRSLARRKADSASLAEGLKAARTLTVKK